MKGMYEEALAVAKAALAAVGLAELEETLARGYAEAGYSGAMSITVIAKGESVTLSPMDKILFTEPFFKIPKDLKK
jgi:hypothetical protein